MLLRYNLCTGLMVFFFYLSIGKQRCFNEAIPAGVSQLTSNSMCLPDEVTCELQLSLPCLNIDRWLMEWTDDIDACMDRIKYMFKPRDVECVNAI